jgi:hypothetical protein
METILKKCPSIDRFGQKEWEKPGAEPARTRYSNMSHGVASRIYGLNRAEGECPSSSEETNKI